MNGIGTAVGLALATLGTSLVFLLSAGQLDVKLVDSMKLQLNDTKDKYLVSGGPNVQYVLFTRNSEELSASGFNSSNPTKIIIHGYTSSITEVVFTSLRDAYLSKGHYNVIGLDWSVLCDSAYLNALMGVRAAGKSLTTFLDWLHSEGVSLDDVHILGHSLGAHVAGLGGDGLGGGRKVARITGLDPAAPGYSDIPENLRLDSGDAKLVDVIHTSVNVLSLGMPLGHVDFYPNGGRFQPGCPTIYDILKIPESLVCNHARAYHYMAEAIRNERAFRSKWCRSLKDALNGMCNATSKVHMGQENTYRPGIYYLKTRDRKPFSME